ncbi:hypothetical protein M5K25_021052 [Dendrobium thyrsiflorum]|uniref:Uncharacterized protein n=1 Tax=Dendrobium thyrsiflorum TaxID=117978 RepID=A0ABD0UBH1_DENTH
MALVVMVMPTSFVSTVSFIVYLHEHRAIVEFEFLPKHVKHYVFSIFDPHYTYILYKSLTQNPIFDVCGAPENQLMHAFFKRGGEGIRCGAFGEADAPSIVVIASPKQWLPSSKYKALIKIWSFEAFETFNKENSFNKNIQPSANPIFCQQVDRIDRVQSTNQATPNPDDGRVERRGTCPLTGGFAVKWHRRINGYDSGPSELGVLIERGIPSMQYMHTIYTLLGPSFDFKGGGGGGADCAPLYPFFL